MKRKLTLAICDLNENVVCDLYDNRSYVSGQAENIFVKKERNGWKELTFDLPSTCMGENGEEKNYRLQYLIADYTIRFEDEYGVDWFVISGPKVTHKAFSQNIEVVAGHISQRLKMKKLDLEFSDDEGNNVGTALQFTTTILDGTGWTPGNVAIFLDDDGKEKKRTLKASAKTGAFKLITDMCDLFEAKPIFNGDKTVDILPMNPFSREITINEEGRVVVGKATTLLPGQTPSMVLNGNRVLELHYGHNTKGITRTLNTDNLVTKLYAYGSYGDVVDGLCDLQDVKHNEYTFTVETEGKEYKFFDKDGNAYFFTAGEPGEYVWSDLDIASRQYIWRSKHYVSYDEPLTENPIELGPIDSKEVVYEFELVADTEYKISFTIPKEKEVLSYVRYFTCSETGIYTWHCVEDDEIYLDSRYLVDWGKCECYKVYKTPKSNYKNLNHVTPRTVKNKFTYVTDYNYFDEVGLLTDEMFNSIADFQRKMPTYLAISEMSAKELTLKEAEASEIGESNTGLLKLDVLSCQEGDNGDLKVIINTRSETHPEGIIYRTDYNEPRRKYFTWYPVEKLKDNGDPYSGVGSVLFVIYHPEEGKPTAWDMFYLKKINDMTETKKEETVEIQKIDGVYKNVPVTTTKVVPAPYIYGKTEGIPEYFTCWANWADVKKRLLNFDPRDRFYLLCTKAMTGLLGGKQVEAEAAMQSLASSTKTVTENHPTFFENKTADYPLTSTETIENTYGWCYLVDNSSDDKVGTLFFCYGSRDERDWHRAYCQDDEPEGVLGDYFYSTKTKEFFHKEQDGWRLWDSTEDRRLATQFSNVNRYCLRRDMLYKGIYERYVIENEALPAGNYAIKTKFGFYWVFTTDRTTNKPYIDTTTYTIYQDNSPEHVVSVDTKLLDSVEHPVENILEKAYFSKGAINEQGVDEDSNEYKRCSNVNVYEDTNYEFKLPADSYVFFYEQHKDLLERRKISSDTPVVIKSPHHTYFMRISVKGDLPEESYIHVENYDKLIYVNDKMYEIVDDDKVSGEGLLKGINFLTKQFADTTDDAYENYLPALLAAQEVVKNRNTELAELLGDIYREGWWQNSDYVDGDQNKLYRDALDNLMQIAKPEATYDIEFLDLYGSEVDSIEEDDVDWPDVESTDAAHLVDPEIDINLWAYLDVVNKCYDKAWQTNITINTNLSTIGQHSFTDVMSAIAEVANETKAKEQIYERASNISPSGQVVTQKLEGAIETYKNAISGGATNWYTDEDGSIIMESADGMTSMKLTGAGLMVASSKDSNGDWIYRTAITGLGLTADEIYTGILSARLIQAGSITTDKLNSTVGHELEISSNKALELFATIDGEKPAGALETTDAIISIKAGDNTTDPPTPAKIDIRSGGEVNIEGGEMKLKSSSSFTIEAGTNLSISSDNLNIYKDNEGKYHASFEGSISADDGDIGGWTIGEHSLNSGTNTDHVELNSDPENEYSFWAGANSAEDAPFYIKKNGDVYARSGTFEIEISSTSGYIGGWTIDEHRLYSEDEEDPTKYIELNSAGPDVIFAGNSTAADASFRVTNQGYVYASNIDIAGGSITLKDENNENIIFQANNEGVIINSGAITINDAAGNLVFSANKDGVTINKGSFNMYDDEGNQLFTINNNGINFSEGKFTVDNQGKLIAQDAEITGAIRASELYILKEGGQDSDYVKSTLTLDKNGNLSSTYYKQHENEQGEIEWVKAANIEFDSSNKIKLTAVETVKGITPAGVSGWVDIKTYLSNITTTSGKISLTSEYFDSMGSSSSGVYITPTKINIFTSGKFTINSTNFKIDEQGRMKIGEGDISTTAAANSVQIGKWAVDPNGQLWGKDGTDFILLDATGGIAISSSKIYNVSNTKIWIRSAGISVGNNIALETDKGEITCKSLIATTGGTAKVSIYLENGKGIISCDKLIVNGHEIT